MENNFDGSDGGYDAEGKPRLIRDGINFLLFLCSRGASNRPHTALKLDSTMW